MEVNRHHLKHPIEILTIKLNLNLEYRQQCLKEVYRIGNISNQPPGYNFTSSTEYIWEETNQFNPLLDEIKSIVNTTVPIPDKRFKYNLSNCWCAIYKKAHSVAPHSHTPAHLSFIYYLKTDLDSSPLIFKGCNFKIQPEDGLLVIFPSEVKHEVPPQKEGNDRICLAGNFDWVLNKPTQN